MSIECIVFTIMLIIAEYFNTAWQTSIFFSKNRCVIHFWNRFLNQKNMCLIFGPFSKLFEQPMIITQPYYPISHPLSMYNPGRRYFDILRYYPSQRYFGILRYNPYYPGRGYFGVSFGMALGPVLGQRRKRCVVFSLSTGFITLHNPTPALMNSLNSCCFMVLKSAVSFIANKVWICFQCNL